MVKLKDYDHFIGRHWETGSVCNYYAYRGVQAPHTGQPYSEALLLGISGGIVMGYFSFAYQGYDPHVAILTRNTFDPMDRLLERLGVEQEIMQTSLPNKGVENLVNTLENGQPAITWVDIYSLPYFELPNDDDMWLMYPVVVYGFDEQSDQAWIADRSRVPLAASATELAAARARVKKDKFRVLTLGNPDPLKLTTAVHKGIWDTIRIFTEPPPKGSRDNFGFAAYKRWADLLTDGKHKSGWPTVFPPGKPMIAGLTSAFFATLQNGEDDGAERSTYAAFLDEASLILKKPALQEAAALFRAAAQAWQSLGCALLPDDVTPFGEIRRLMVARREQFYTRGGEARAEIDAINAQIRRLKSELGVNFPLDEPGLRVFMDNLRGQIMQVHDVEQKAIQALQAAMTD